MGSVDLKLASRQKHSLKRKQMEKDRKGRWEKEAIISSEKVVLALSSSSGDTDSETD